MPFTSILGHERQKQLLGKALATDHLASAYLFCGPEGIGKRLLAGVFIKTILCASKNSCNHCRSCLQYDEGNHLDLIALDGSDSAIKIDDIRAVQKQLQFKPMESGKRICLIDCAENMTFSAQTALLKSLEEPKLHTMFILISGNAEALLPTIRSRCQILRFNRLPLERLKEKLAEDLAGEASHTSIMATFSDGSFKKSLGDKRDFYLHERKEILHELTSLPPLETHIQDCFSLAQKLAAKKDLTQNILEILKLFYRDTLFRLHGRPDTDFINSDMADLVRTQGEKESIASTLEKLEAIRDIEEAINKNTNPQLSFEVLLMRLTAQPHGNTPTRTV